MNAPTASRFSRTVVAAALALALPLTGLALDRTSGATLIVTVFADRYVAADVQFPDLDALEALVSPMNPSLVRLEACGPDAATALLAAAERFRDSNLEMRVLAVAEPACIAASAGTVRVIQLAGPVPSRAADTPSDRYWQSVMP